MPDLVKSFDYTRRYESDEARHEAKLARRRAKYAANRNRINADRRLGECAKHIRKVDREIETSIHYREWPGAAAYKLRWYHANSERINAATRAKRARERAENPKSCVICGAEFLRYKKQNTCSPQCSALRKAQLTHESHLRTRPRKPRRGPPQTSAEKSRAWRERNPDHGAAYMRQRRAEKSTIIIQQESRP
jgi:hypothetical protein